MKSSKFFESAYILIQLPPKDIALLKYFLEAQDNLGYLRVLDRKRAFLYAITSSSQKEELYNFLTLHTTIFTSLIIFPEISI